MLKTIEDRDGRLNCAGILGLVQNATPTTESTPLAVWDRVLAVNLTGPFLVSRAALPLMRKNKWGRIVNIASRAGRARGGSASYSASKAGLIALSRVLAGEVGRDGITVNCISPSRVTTALTADVSDPAILAARIAETPLGRLAVPQDIAGVAAFLVSDDANFITGAIIDVTGGQFMP